MAQLPESHSIDIAALSRIFGRTTNSYKFLFFQSLLFLIKNDLFKNHTLLRGQKHYFPAPEWGAFWVDMIVDTRGDIIKVLSPNSKHLGECVPLGLILDQDEKHPKLKQSMEECVYVER